MLQNKSEPEFNIWAPQLNTSKHMDQYDTAPSGMALILK